jgi:hypothetical protein
MNFCCLEIGYFSFGRVGAGQIGFLNFIIGFLKVDVLECFHN